MIDRCLSIPNQVEINSVTLPEKFKSQPWHRVPFPFPALLKLR